MFHVEYEIVIGGIRRQAWFTCRGVEPTDEIVRSKVCAIWRIKDKGQSIIWKVSVKDGVL